MGFRRSLATAALVASAIFVGTVGSVAAASPAAPSTSTTTPTACAGHWPAVFNGVPTNYKAGARSGTYLWHGSRGFYLRVTHPGTAKVVFSGRIVSDQPMTVQPIRVEGKDYVTLTADKKTILYRFTNYGRIDGLNFQTACASKVTFTLNANWQHLPRWRVWIGATNAHPLQNPFTVERVL